MKRYRFSWMTIMMMVFVCVGFSACGNDDDDNGKPRANPFGEGNITCPDAKHPHWINLGLPSGTQWRCCNDGASTPEDYGNYNEFGKTASAPSLDQIEELCNNTTSVWTTQNGVNGRKYTGSNGGTIFLPAGGYGLDRNGKGSRGYYWSSTPDEGNWACCFVFSASSSKDKGIYSRYGDLPVRPVR